MIRITRALRNMLVQTPEIQSRVQDKTIGSDATWATGWVFADMPEANIEKRSHQALIVVSYDGQWQEPNAHNTARFPRILLDIWASPTRQPGGSPRQPDADLLIEEIFEDIRPYIHTIQPSVPGNRDLDQTKPYLGRPGNPRIWGTFAEIATATGVLVMSSQQVSEPTFFDVKDGNGARMGRYVLGVHTA